jgi:hypothetical protein
MNDTDLLFDFLKTRQLQSSKKLDLVGVINFGGGMSLPLNHESLNGYD